MYLSQGKREKIKSMQCMQDLLAVYRRIKYQDYKQWLSDYTCRSMFKFQELGALNKDKNIFLIGNIGKVAGLFWSWKEACRGLMVAERYGFTPVVDWTRGVYFEEEGYDGCMNPFEYYFKPVSNISLEEAVQSYNVSYYNNHSCDVYIPGYGFQEYKMMDEFVRINKKYIHIKEDLYEDMSLQIKQLLKGKKTIGVHVRGVEWGKIKGHPVPATLEDYIRRIDIGVKQNNYEQIFLATDSEETVAFFREYFGNTVVCYNDIERTPQGSRTLVIFDEKNRGEHSRYWLGYEVIKDMLTLSYCQGLVAGLSYVSFAAEVFKLSRGEKYMYKNMVEQTVCRKGMLPLKAMRLMKKNKYKG